MNKQILVSALGVMLLASCADRFDQNFETVRPEKAAEYGYLEQYDALKEYVADKPNFHLGIGTTVADYNKQELVYALTNSNFNETVAGNAMKMASCVDDNGNMTFDAVSDYVNNATDAGLSVFGHTLAWHSQQANKWLNNLIAPREIPIDPDAKVDVVDYEMDWSKQSSYNFWAPDEVKAGISVDASEGALKIVNEKAIDNWMVQYHVADGMSGIQSGKDYKVTMKIKATGEGQMSWGIGGWGARAEGIFKFDTDWKDVEANITAVQDGGFMLCQTGQFVGTIYIKDIKVTHSEAPMVEIFTDYLTNGEMNAGGDMSNFVVREAGKADVPGTPIAGGPDGKNCIVIHANANASTEWDTQFFIYTPNKTWSKGEKYKITFYYKASEAIGADTQCHGEPGGYKHWACLSPNPNFTTEWQKYESNGTIPAEGDGMKSIAFNLNKGTLNHAVDFYFADIHWGQVEKGNKQPLTAEEKKEVLTGAMDQWIGAMMDATEGKVKAWDVVNEALSGADKDGDGKYDLQSATRGNVSESDAANNFYWQDYLGDLDYVRTAVASARTHFAEAGGIADELKLFINDYNLESDWDQNGKLKSLIQWIKDWEADGKTKIDGIGSQMHISCYANAQTQESKKNAIVNMLQLMAQSGKLCRISELDMGYVDAAGNSVKTADMTEDQHKQMRDLYEFVVKKYLEIIPEAQQWGICQWCATDAPATSGWRGGEPTGLWDLDYYRKHTFGGFAAGLGAPEYWNENK